jgi:hypothetical protein
LLCDRCTWKTPTLWWCYYCWSMIICLENYLAFLSSFLG